MPLWMKLLRRYIWAGDFMSHCCYSSTICRPCCFFGYKWSSLTCYCRRFMDMLLSWRKVHLSDQFQNLYPGLFGPISGLVLAKVRTSQVFFFAISFHVPVRMWCGLHLFRFLFNSLGLVFDHFVVGWLFVIILCGLTT
jgi:hypothetical protein